VTAKATRLGLKRTRNCLLQEDGMKGRCAINLHNAVTVLQQRIGKRVARLGPRRMSEVCWALRFPLGCD